MVNKLPIPFNNPRTYKGHSGVDYGQPEGTPFRASDSGIVTGRGLNKRGGFYIWVRYDSITPRVGYHHLPSYVGTLAPGTRFNKGDRLGYVGNTGNSTGPHLHSEVAGYATTEGYWKFFDRNRVITDAVEPIKSETEKDDEMPIIIVQRKNSQLAKGMMTHNRKMREITRWENICYRKAQDAAPGSVIYVTVTDAEYANLLAGKD